MSNKMSNKKFLCSVFLLLTIAVFFFHSLEKENIEKEKVELEKLKYETEILAIEILEEAENLQNPIFVEKVNQIKLEHQKNAAECATECEQDSQNVDDIKKDKSLHDYMNDLKKDKKARALVLGILGIFFMCSPFLLLSFLRWR